MSRMTKEDTYVMGLKSIWTRISLTRKSLVKVSFSTKKSYSPKRTLKCLGLTASTQWLVYVCVLLTFRLFFHTYRGITYPAVRMCRSVISTPPQITLRSLMDLRAAIHGNSAISVLVPPVIFVFWRAEMPQPRSLSDDIRGLMWRSVGWVPEVT